jgi:16S rRNA C967 or C1407 C5-methylase (RsmB/RsmF family)
LKKLKGKMQWVFVDAPCSGTGTLRRNPDMKWKLSEETVNRMVGMQRNIFEQALSYLAPGGSIIYGTCSILAEENELQTAHFIHTYGLEVVGTPLQILPQENGADGFYGVVFRKKT